MQTFAVHTDSVWTLLASPDFSLVYSGGRDNCVYRWIAELQALTASFHTHKDARRQGFVRTGMPGGKDALI